MLRKKVCDVESETVYPIDNDDAYLNLSIRGDKDRYYFDLESDGKIVNIGSTYNKNLSSECSFSPFTGVVAGFYVTGSSRLYVKKFIYTTE